MLEDQYSSRDPLKAYALYSYGPQSIYSGNATRNAAACSDGDAARRSETVVEGFTLQCECAQLQSDDTVLWDRDSD